MLLLRSLLFVPGNQSRMLEKAVGLTPDAYVPDLEDSVPWDEKSNARNVTASYLSRLAAMGPLVLPRVNSLDTGLIEDDLKAVVDESIFGVSVGKIGSAGEVHAVAGILTGIEKRSGLAEGAVKLVLWLETARGIVNAYEICKASPRVVAVAFGAEDLTNDLGIPRTDQDAQIAYPRSAIAIAARAADVLALDTPYFTLHDSDGLTKDAHTARSYGFRGKFAIHPEQIDPINEVFSPSAEEVAQARRVLDVFEEANQSGRGSTSLDGKVIDVPVVRRAEKLLEQADFISNHNAGEN